jgi:hypothetical protein
MKRIYVAGALNSDACGYIKNLHQMILWAEKVRKGGFAVFIPGIDFLAGLQCGDWEYSDYFDNSQPWLDVSDAVFIVPGWEKSDGTKKEIVRAKENGTPVFWELDALINHFYGKSTQV